MKTLLINIVFLLLIFGSLSAKPQVVLIKVHGAISPGSAGYIQSGIEEAQKKNAKALIIQLNTPGGLLESTRDIIESIFSSKVPVIVYVAPGGARAGSAGVFITLAANIAAMAPGTNIGAAHPVGMQGESGDSNSVIWGKVTNDAAAFIRSIAQKRHRNVDWAERAVRQSISATEYEALKDSVIDFVCPSVDSLLKVVDGLTVETAAGNVRLETARADIINLGTDWRSELLSIISDPNFAYILMMIGIYGILFEIFHPGSIFPGVAGGISLILAFYSMRVLPINYAGLFLILLGVILFVLEVKIVSHGMLTIGGIAALFLGSLMLIDSTEEYMKISLSLIITTIVITTLFFTFVISLGIKAQYKKRSGGAEGLIGERGVAISDITPETKGKVKIHGEIWKASADNNIRTGEKVIVENVESLTIKVKSI